MARCNPYGYATDAGPKHLMGGFYGPEYAGKMTTLEDGIHGPAICTRNAEVRARMICPNGHYGPIMDLCVNHARELQTRMSDCCTRCVWPDAARDINDAMDRTMYAMAEAWDAEDRVTLLRLNSHLDDLRRAMDELLARGIIKKVPLTLVEISLCTAAIMLSSSTGYRSTAPASIPAGTRARSCTGCPPCLSMMRPWSKHTGRSAIARTARARHDRQGDHERARSG